MRNPIFSVVRDQASIVNGFCFLFANENSPRNTPFFFDRLKQLLVVQILEVTVYDHNENICV